MWEGFSTQVYSYVNAILIGVIGTLAAFVVYQVMTRFLVRPMGKGWSRFVGSLAALAIMLWTAKLILDTAGAAGLVVVLVTAASGAFALGSERFAADLVSGISLFITKPYAVGDSVQLAGQEGNVADISLMLTTLQTVQGDRIYIRNSDVAATTIVNHCSMVNDLGEYSVQISVMLALPAAQDPKAAISVIEKAIQDFAPNFKNGADQPSVVVESASPEYFALEVRAFVTERKDYAPEKTRLLLLAINALKDAGLT